MTLFEEKFSRVIGPIQINVSSPRTRLKRFARELLEFGFGRLFELLRIKMLVQCSLFDDTAGIDLLEEIDRI